MKIVLAVIALAFVQASANAKSQRQPAAPQQVDTETIQVRELGVPSGYMILGESTTPPPGYVFTGLSIAAEPTSLAWRTAPPMPTPRTELGAAAVPGRIFAIGGFLGSFLGTTEEFSVELDAWITRMPMPTARTRPAVVSANGRVYAVGGFNGTPLAANEEFNPATNSWSPRAPMPTARTMLAAAEVSGRIYAIGGSQDGITRLSVVEEYDPLTNVWTSKAPMPTPRAKLSVAVLDGRILAFGGDNPPMPVEEYDPATNAWTTRSIGVGGYDWSAVELNNRVYRFGGYGDPSATLEYNPESETWRFLPALPTPRTTLAAVVLEGGIYTLGGSNFEGQVFDTVEVFDPGRPLYVHRRK